MTFLPALELPSAVGRLHRLRRPAGCWGRQALLPQCGSVGKGLRAQLICRAMHRPHAVLFCGCATTTGQLTAVCFMFVVAMLTGGQTAPFWRRQLFVIEA